MNQIHAGNDTTLPKLNDIETSHSIRMLRRIHSEIDKAGGVISFARFMELALYEPELGYYCAGTRKFGPGGDFITAPELSTLFSRCLANQCREILDQIGGGIILELGAGTGIMAAVILQELRRLDKLPESYAILEISAELRMRQKQTISKLVPELLDRVIWLEKLPRSDMKGIILGNEVLDALPVERFRITTMGPRRLGVTWTDDMYPANGSTTGLCLIECKEDQSVTTVISKIEAELGYRLPDNYVSEYSPQLTNWICTISDMLTTGALIFIDYGYSRREYYHPDRTDGTLLCHYRHRVHTDPFIFPGLQDITANVDFTALANIAQSINLNLAGYTSQNYFLFGCGIMELLSNIDTTDTFSHLEQARQVKLLTLPGEMGDRFKAICLTRGFNVPLRGFSIRNERNRL
jgi:SAM-dependent MidA family methyltransferase